MIIVARGGVGLGTIKLGPLLWKIEVFATIFMHLCQMAAL